MEVKKLQRVGEYILTECIGEGSYGKVYLGYHKKTKKSVAIKKIFTNLFSKKDFEALALEKQTLKTFDHPNILKLISCYHVLK